ncbi:MAG: glycosyltransferase family 2 protein [Bacteroidota bacterium]
MVFSWPWGVSPTFSADHDGPLPRISIVTPNYNGARYLEATIRSVICQGYPNLQYIVVDGGSTDGSLEIINRYRDHISVVISEPDNGHGDALNKGFQRADGQILAWLNSDDMYLPWTFQTVAEVFTKFPHVRWIEGLQSYWDVSGRLYGTQNSLPLNQYDYLLGCYEWIQQESTFWTKDLWSEAGGRIAEDYKLMIDGELWARFFLHSRLHRVGYHLSGFRPHGANRSHNTELLRQEMARAIDALRAAAPPEALDLVKQFKRIRKLLSPIPSAAIQGGIARRLIPEQLRKMGYEIIWRDPDLLGTDSWKISEIPFRYSRVHPW